MDVYRASKSRSQNRKGWYVTFRHPLRKDATGKVGLKVRRGLGTADDQEADLLVKQMNELLLDDTLWSIHAKSRARSLYDERVIAAFYEDLEPMQMTDLKAVRERELPYPRREEDYNQIRFTGGHERYEGLRQLLGLADEPFLQSNAIHAPHYELEWIACDSPTYEAVVTFLPFEKTKAYIEECVMKAAISYACDGGDHELARHFLQHEHEPFALRQLIGTTPAFYVTRFTATQPNVSVNEHVQEYIEIIRSQALQVRERLMETHDFTEKQFTYPTDDVLLAFEETWRGEIEFTLLIDALMEEVEKRFHSLPQGRWTYTSEEWPECWRFQAKDPNVTLRILSILTSQDESKCGKLLTPLVEGIRVRGSFSGRKGIFTVGPEKNDRVLSTNTMKGIDQSHTLVWVQETKRDSYDHMLPTLRYLISTGQIEKLHLYMHGDESEEWKRHAGQALEIVLNDVKRELGWTAYSQAERQILRNSLYFSVEEVYERTIHTIEEYELPSVHPIYTNMMLSLVVKDACDAFYQKLETQDGLREKALCRRFAELGEDEYGGMKPQALMFTTITETFYRSFFTQPSGWSHEDLTNDKREEAIAAICMHFSKALRTYLQTNVCHQQIGEWQSAYGRNGKNAKKKRAQDLNVIFEDVLPSSHRLIDQPKCVKHLYGLMKEAIESSGGILLS
ncbi:hypothetical protein ACQKJC_12045 [Priestia koreensis]|uniref:hypothetical protein n=1 Tax=Priestia koreensis TaxID=284581 RepID=UPI00203DC528|nr:hypothetical protein [Priestia koreensis]MCM3002983.1 hypothetical protein [Priestia koreensis]